MKANGVEVIEIADKQPFSRRRAAGLGEHAADLSELIERIQAVQ